MKKIPVPPLRVTPACRHHHPRTPRLQVPQPVMMVDEFLFGEKEPLVNVIVKKISIHCYAFCAILYVCVELIAA